MPRYTCHHCHGISTVDEPVVKHCPLCFREALPKPSVMMAAEVLPPIPQALPEIPPLNEITRAAFNVPGGSEQEEDADDEDICYEELGVFDQVWDMAAEQGGCDARGGAEYRRVAAIWERGGQRLVTLMFILRQASNMTPEQATEWTAKNLDALFRFE